MNVIEKDVTKSIKLQDHKEETKYNDVIISPRILWGTEAGILF